MVTEVHMHGFNTLLDIKRQSGADSIRNGVRALFIFSGCRAKDVDVSNSADTVTARVNPDKPLNEQSVVFSCLNGYWFNRRKTPERKGMTILFIPNAGEIEVPDPPAKTYERNKTLLIDYSSSAHPTEKKGAETKPEITQAPKPKPKFPTMIQPEEIEGRIVGTANFDTHPTIHLTGLTKDEFGDDLEWNKRYIKKWLEDLGCKVQRKRDVMTATLGKNESDTHAILDLTGLIQMTVIVGKEKSHLNWD